MFVENQKQRMADIIDTDYKPSQLDLESLQISVHGLHGKKG